MHDMRSSDRPATRFATRAAFFASGFGMAAWAPLVPYAKARLALDDAGFGLVLLGLGVGSVIAMPLAGGLVARYGSRPMILVGCLGLAAMLPLLAVAASPTLVAMTLFVFGAALGSMDVAMNVHATEVEQAAGVPLMSGFHAQFSLGGLAGAAVGTLLLAIGAQPLVAASVCAAVVLLVLAAAAPGLLRTRPGQGDPMFALPHGIVIALGLMAFAAFLTEGAMLDWGGVFLVQERGLAPAYAGIGYALFSVAMVVGRFAGDRLIAAFGGVRIILAGAMLVAAGIAWLLLVAQPWLAAVGFLAVGLGAATRVPILFSAAGRQGAMPAPLAIASTVTIAYAGVLAGPALVGFAAQATSLPAAFAMLAFMMAMVPAFGRLAASLEGPR